MKNCALCQFPARTFCKADQASLCWDCDSMVHGANFLVERHMRTILCYACQSHTPRIADGAMIADTLSLCQRCAARNKIEDELEESEEDIDDDINSEEEEDEDGDNQVVPLSSKATPPPPASSYSNSEDSVSRCNNKGDEIEITSQSLTTVSSKRRRPDHDFQNSSVRVYQRRLREEEPPSKLAVLLRFIKTTPQSPTVVTEESQKTLDEKEGTSEPYIPSE